MLFRKRHSSNGRQYWVAGLTITVGAGLGAGLMYVFDPNCGQARRKRVSRRAISLLAQGEHLVEQKGKDILNRAEGVTALARSLFHRVEDISDDVVLERVRSRLGHVIQHPQSIATKVVGGVVTLTGTVDRAKRKQLLKQIRAVPGVKDVEELLIREGRPNGRSFPKLLGSLAGAAVFLLMARGASQSGSRRAA